MDSMQSNSRNGNIIRSCSLFSAEKKRGRFPCAVIALFVFMGLSCAKQGFPPGGSSDEAAPHLLNSSPGSLATNVSRNEPVKLAFSEPMDTQSVEDNLFIVPIPASWPEYEWRSGDRELYIHLSQPFRENTTYVLSIGAKARDLRRNQLEESIMLSFSTGDVVEDGAIRGKIIPYRFGEEDRESVSGVDVAAYHMDGETDPPDPRNNVPGYVTQSGADGTYELIGLSSGKYRLFAVGDRDRDGFYSEGYDLIGISPHDVVLAESDSVTYAPDIAIAERDTSGVQLVSIAVPDRRRVELYFDRDIQPDGILVEFDGLDIPDWFIPHDSPGVISAVTAPQEGGRRYSLKNVQVTDSDGNRFVPLDVTPFFTGKDNPDTTALELLAWKPDILSPGREPVRCVFNRALTLPVDTDEVLDENSRRDISVVSASPNILELVPRDAWLEDENYSISFDREKLRGAAGNRLTEEGSQLSFRIASADTLGFITGSVEDSRGGSESVYRLMLRHIDTETVRAFAVSGPEQWSSGPVLPGRYLCRGFRDDDGDGVLFRGSVYPYNAAEQVYAFPDTIMVVSRWTNDDNTIIFR